MDNIKQVVKDVRFLIATDCCDETIQSRIENFINEREQALRIHDVVGRSEQLVAIFKKVKGVTIPDTDEGVDAFVKQYSN
jgi:hypothetical protein